MAFRIRASCVFELLVQAQILSIFVSIVVIEQIWAGLIFYFHANSNLGYQYQTSIRLRCQKFRIRFSFDFQSETLHRRYLLDRFSYCLFKVKFYQQFKNNFVQVFCSSLSGNTYETKYQHLRDKSAGLEKLAK